MNLRYTKYETWMKRLKSVSGVPIVQNRFLTVFLRLKEYVKYSINGCPYNVRFLKRFSQGIKKYYT